MPSKPENEHPAPIVKSRLMVSERSFSCAVVLAPPMVKLPSSRVDLSVITLAAGVSALPN